MMHTSKLNIRKAYFENLDGLRFIAFLSVFICHCIAFFGFKVDTWLGERIVGHFFMNGDLGVNFFFVLSGFLITFLLLQEKSGTNNISIKHFYFRRILRIWPVYFLTLIVGFFLIPFLFQNIDLAYLPFGIEVPLNKLSWYLGFAVNFDMILNGVNYAMIAVLWSVSVEEQFYLVWPLINKIFSKKVLVIILALLLISSYCYRWFYWNDKTVLRYSTFSVMNDLIVGSIIAVYSEKFKNIFHSMSKQTIIIIYILFCLFIPLRGFFYYFSDTIDQVLISTESFIFSLFFAFIILEQNYATNSVFKISKIKLFTYLGKISYGLYCYHMIFIFIVAVLFKMFFGKYLEASFTFFIAQCLLSLSLTTLFSKISYKYFESRFLKLKEKY